jgi:curved DNA-binding protein CbpA
VASAAPPLTALRAYDALGLAPTASAADVEKAFRERALLCHPDKVAHLDPDFVALAEQKFRLLQAAKDLLLGVVARPDDVRRK